MYLMYFVRYDNLGELQRIFYPMNMLINVDLLIQFHIEKPFMGYHVLENMDMTQKLHF